MQYSGPTDHSRPMPNMFGEPVIIAARMSEINYDCPRNSDSQYQTGVSHQQARDLSFLNGAGIILTSEPIETPPWTEIVFAAVLTVFFLSPLTCVPLFIACAKASESDQYHRRGMAERGNLAARQARRWMRCLYATLFIWLIIDIILVMSLRESASSGIPIPGLYHSGDEGKETPRTTTRSPGA